jgi:hypothetical protein
MPSEASAVGALELPIAPGAVGDKLADPIIEAVLSFAGFYIKDALDEKLKNILPSGLMLDAVPNANRFDFDPLEPQGIKVTLPVPCLFVWWEGISTVMEKTLLYSFRVRNLHLLYVFPELPKLSEVKRRAGLISSVDAAMHKMSERQLHTSYSYNGNPAGMGIAQALAPLGVVGWEYVGGQPGRFGIDEGPGADRRVKKHSARDYPALRGVFKIHEKVQPMTMEDPGDVLHDGNFSINGAGEGTQPTFIMDRVLTAPDGTENP